MLPLIRSLLAPLLSLVFMMMGGGLFNTFVSLRLEMEGYNIEEIGLVTSALYFGILIGSIWIDRLISKMGHVRSFVLFAALLAFLTLSQAFWINAWYWCALRLIGGFCMAGVFIVIESWFLMQSPPNLRGAALSIYLAVFYAAVSCGQLLIDVSNPHSIYPFCITAFLVTLSILPISLQKTTEMKKPSTSSRLNIVQMYRISPLGFMGGIISGMLLAVIYGLGPVYANESGMSVSEIGTFMAVLIFGGFSLQLPLGHLADKTDRRRVLNFASFMAAFLAVALALFHSASFTLLLILAWLFGGFSFTLYPISMSYACEKIKEDQIVAATGGFVLSYGIGAIAGPLMAPIVMNLLGPAGFFYFLGSITLLLGLIGLKRPAPAMLDDE